MLIRIVRMEFHPEKVGEFRKLFDKHKHKIRSQPGCLKLELHVDKHKKNVLFTYSYWESEEKLQLYRFSPVFKEVWPLTKALFAGKPMAFSLEKLEEVPAK